MNENQRRIRHGMEYGVDRVINQQAAEIERLSRGSGSWPVEASQGALGEAGRLDFGGILRSYRVPAAITGPPAPTTTTGSGGSITGKVYIFTTYTLTDGTERMCASLVTVDTGSGGLAITVDSPPAIAGFATSWNVYASTSASGPFTKQQGNIAIGTDATLNSVSTSGASPPPPAYTWNEAFTSGSGTISQQTGGTTGTTQFRPAYETTGNYGLAVDGSFKAELRLTDDTTAMVFDAPGVTSGGGGGGGGTIILGGANLFWARITGAPGGDQGYHFVELMASTSVVGSFIDRPGGRTNANTGLLAYPALAYGPAASAGVNSQIPDVGVGSNQVVALLWLQPDGSCYQFIVPYRGLTWQDSGSVTGGGAIGTNHDNVNSVVLKQGLKIANSSSGVVDIQLDLNVNGLQGIDLATFSNNFNVTAGVAGQAKIDTVGENTNLQVLTGLASGTLNCSVTPPVLTLTFNTATIHFKNGIVTSWTTP